LENSIEEIRSARNPCLSPLPCSQSCRIVTLKGGLFGRSRLR